MNTEDHEYTGKPNSFEPGSNRTSRPAFITYQGIKGGMKYWAKKLGISHKTVAYRTRLYAKGLITFDEMMQEKPIAGKGSFNGKIPSTNRTVHNVGILPSGIPEVTSLI